MWKSSYLTKLQEHLQRYFRVSSLTPWKKSINIFKKIPQNLGTVYWKNTSLLLLSNTLKTFLFLKTGFCNFPFHNSMKFSKFSPVTLTSNCGEFLGLLKYHWDTIKQWFHWNKEIFSKTYPSCKQYLRLSKML